MMKRFFTSLACAVMLLPALAQSAGDYVYTEDGRFKILSETNLISNGNFADGTTGWTTDGGNPLSVDTFSVSNEGPDGSSCLVVNMKENGPGTGSSLLRTIPVTDGMSYVVSYQVKGNDDAVTTTITSEANAKNYQNIFFNEDGSLTPAADGAIATRQTYGWDWSTVTYGFTAPAGGYLVIHFFAPYIGTSFADFKLVEAQQVVDDREANLLIARLQAYMDDPRFPNGHDILEGIIAIIREYIDTDDLNGYLEILPLIDEGIKEFLDTNTADMTGYVKNGDFDDLKPTGANQVKAGAWTIDDGLRAVNPTGKTRWSVKADDGTTPFTGNYLQNDIPYGSKNKLYEATVHQTIENMPAAEYMFTIKLRGYMLLNKAGDRNTDIRGMKVFINNDSTECYPVDDEKASSFTAYSTLKETGSLKLGFYMPDSVANHIDLDVVDLRIIGWTSEQVDEFFMGKEFAEAKTTLKHSIDSARVHYDNPEMLYGKPQLDSAIVASQYYYDNITVTDSLIDSNARLLKEISNYISRNSSLTALRKAILNAEELVADVTYAEADRQKLQVAIDAAKTFLATLTAENHLTEGYTNADIQAQTAQLNKVINILLASKLVADEKYEFLNWASEEGAAYESALEGDEEKIVTSSSGATLLYETATFAGHSLNNRFAFYAQNTTRSLNTTYGFLLTFSSKNATTMAITGLKEGDMVTMDWTMGNNSHSLMVASANARVKLADGSWQNYTKVGKDNANVLPKDNNDGLSGTVRSTIIMNAEGTLDFYQGSSNSTIRICYIGITNAENVKDGIQTLSTSLNTTDSAVYDLQGRRLSEKPVRGLYIQNGRKFFVK